MGTDILSLIDAAYTVDVGEEAWLRGVADAARVLLDVGLGIFTVAYDASNPDQFCIRASIVEGVAEELAPNMARHVQLFDREWVEETFRRFTCDHIRNPRFARHPAGSPQLLDSVYARHGIQDILSINAIDPSGLGYQINVMQPRKCLLTPSVKDRWSRVAAHIAAGKRLRQRLGSKPEAQPDAVLSPDGKVAHAAGSAKSKHARERLADAVRARERSHGKLRRINPDLAIAEWKGLVAARWTLVEQFESDGRRYLLARQNDPEVSGLDSLTERERCAVGFAALGHSNKLIAYEMGITRSTVSVLLCRAGRRLGARSRAEMIRKFVEHTMRAK